MIKLIVNADDFGITKGVNRGITEVAKNGILTSTSVMVNRPYASEIKEFHKQFPNIGVGVHVEFPGELLARSKNGGNIDETEILDTLEEQIRKFKQLAGFAPDHMDFHKVAVRSTKSFVADNVSIFKPPIEKISQKYQLPWRGIEGITVIDTFHGAVYDPSTHAKSQSVFERISSDSLIEILKTLTAGCYELMSHPGFVDDELTSSYKTEREIETKTLCDPSIVAAVKTLGIQLVTYHERNHTPGV